MKNINKILERQDAHLRFKDGKVQYFSISTQHSEANTIEEAIENIIKADKLYERKSSFHYAVKKYEEELPLSEYGNTSFTKEDVDAAIDFFKDSLRKEFGIKIKRIDK